MGRAHFLTAETGYAALGADDCFALHNLNDLLGAGFGALATTDTFVRCNDGECTLASKKVMKQTIVLYDKAGAETGRGEIKYSFGLKKKS